MKELDCLKLKKYPFELSGGEQQRTAIARALLNTPELIIADEPTGNLDPQTSNEIMEVFKKLHKQGIAVFMATHDLTWLWNFLEKFLNVILEKYSKLQNTMKIIINYNVNFKNP